MLTRLMSAAVLASMIAVPYAAYAEQSPTLGEIARKEQERRKALKAPAAKVLTNEDLPRAAAPAPTPTAAPEPDRAAAADKPADKPEEPAKDEAWWRQRMTQAREELRRNEMFAEALQTRINSLTTDFAARDDPFQRAKIGDERAKATLELDRVKADVESNRKKLADIEEEARRASVPPGWLR
jgi:hypothetical protein